MKSETSKQHNPHYPFYEPEKIVTKDDVKAMPLFKALKEYGFFTTLECKPDFLATFQIATSIAMIVISIALIVISIMRLSK